MDSLTQSASAATRLPAQRIDADGRTHVDQRAALALALPLIIAAVDWKLWLALDCFYEAAAFYPWRPSEVAALWKAG